MPDRGPNAVALSTDRKDRPKVKWGWSGADPGHGPAPGCRGSRLLPEGVAGDPERLTNAVLRHEARMIASLNHTNVAAIRDGLGVKQTGCTDSSFSSVASRMHHWPTRASARSKADVCPRVGFGVQHRRSPVRLRSCPRCKRCSPIADLKPGNTRALDDLQGTRYKVLDFRVWPRHSMTQPRR